jgi:uncharacterized protein (DUF1015 family)
LADIRPFRGVHYNPAKIKNLSKVICPPYDIIPPQMQQELHQQSDYNFIRVEFGLESPHDSSTDNKYIRAEKTMKEWLDNEILVTDKLPCIYIDEHSFIHQGKTWKRRSINAVVKLEDWSKMIIRPHEGTLAKAKSDRLNVLWTLHTNTSPIMVLYQDRDREISKILVKQLKNKPAFTVGKINGESHRIWAISDQDTIMKLHSLMADQPFYIADGHHRYESALNYQRERRSTYASSKAEEPFDFVMMTLLDMADPGLVILPAHRMVSGLSASALEVLSSRLETFFIVEEAEINNARLKTQLDALLYDDKNGSRIVLSGLKKDRLLALTLREPESVKSMFPAFHTDIYQSLDVSIVDHVILEELLDISQEKMGSYLNWIHDPVTAVERVQAGEYQLGIIVNPIKPEVIKAIADKSDRMPKKSTYFYPKVPAGLVSYRF